MPAHKSCRFFLTDRQINRSIDEIWNNARRSVCESVLSLLRRISIFSIIAKHLNENQLNGWNWNSVNWNSLFLSTRSTGSLTGFQQNSGSYFLQSFIVKIIVCFRCFIQSDTLYLPVPTTTTTFVRLFVCSLVLTWVICIKINIWNVVACTNQHPLKYTNRLGNLIVMTHILPTSDSELKELSQTIRWFFAYKLCHREVHYAPQVKSRGKCHQKTKNMFMSLTWFCIPIRLNHLFRRGS